EERVGACLGAWLRGEARGEGPDRREWLARHAEFAADLEELLADEDRLRAVARPLRALARAALPPTPLPGRSAAPGGPGGRAPDPAGPPPRSFGDYELLEEIGRGGGGGRVPARPQRPRPP